MNKQVLLTSPLEPGDFALFDQNNWIWINMQSLKRKLIKHRKCFLFSFQHKKNELKRDRINSLPALSTSMTHSPQYIHIDP